jgi:chromosome segregation ATPase
MFRSKPLEERLVAIVRSELAGSAADLEGRRREYRRRLESKKQARAALENAEAETSRLRSERVARKKGFWEEYYGNGQDTVHEIDPEARSLERAIKEAQKSLESARTKFEEADFDEVTECSALIAEANAVEEEANRRLDVLEETLKDLVAGLRGDLKEAGRALRDECQDAQEEVGTLKHARDLRMPVQPRRGRSMTQIRRLLTKESTRDPGHRNLPVAAFFVLVGLFCAWVGLVEIKGKVPLALVLVSIGFTNLVTAALYTLPTGRLRTLARTWIAGISLVLGAIGVAVWRLLT